MTTTNPSPESQLGREHPSAAPVLLSVVVPVFNSRVVDLLVGEIEAALGALRIESFEIVLVDDASTDSETWHALERVAATRPSVVAVQLTRNSGQQAATLCGLAESRGAWVATLDDDFQHDPADLAALWARRDADIVIAQFPVRRDTLIRRWLSRVKGWFDRRILGLPHGIRLSSYRLLARPVVDGVLAIRTPRPFLPALMLDVSRNVVGVTVTQRARRVGTSGYTIPKMWGVFGNLLINNSSLLLRVVGQAGVLFAILSFIAAGWVTYRRLAHQVAVAGWASLLVVNLLLGGLTLFAIGVIGEYLMRVIEIGENRPAYHVRRRVSGADAVPRQRR